MNSCMLLAPLAALLLRAAGKGIAHRGSVFPVKRPPHNFCLVGGSDIANGRVQVRIVVWLENKHKTVRSGIRLCQYIFGSPRRFRNAHMLKYSVIQIRFFRFRPPSRMMCLVVLLLRFNYIDGRFAFSVHPKIYP